MYDFLLVFHMKYHERSLLVAISAEMAKQARRFYHRDRKWKLSNIKILLYKPINQNNLNKQNYKK